jgi:hypothetical protein
VRRFSLVLGLVGLGLLIAGCITSTPQTYPVASKIDDLAAMELNPPNNYVDQLTAVIEGDGEPYLRERAVFTLTRIALGRNETSSITPYLKDLAMHTRTDEIRTAAYANLALINSLVLPSPRGYLNLSIEGTIKRESPIRLVATVSSTVPVTASLVGIRRLPQGMDLNSDALVRLSLLPNQSQTVIFQMTPRLVGTYTIPVSLVLSLDQVESYEKTAEVSITVREGDGNYTVREWEGALPEGGLADMTERVSHP